MTNWEKKVELMKKERMLIWSRNPITKRRRQMTSCETRGVIHDREPSKNQENLGKPRTMHHVQGAKT